jgi:hypothetical protein
MADEQRPSGEAKDPPGRRRRAPTIDLKATEVVVGMTRFASAARALGRDARRWIMAWRMPDVVVRFWPIGLGVALSLAVVALAVMILAPWRAPADVTPALAARIGDLERKLADLAPVAGATPAAAPMPEQWAARITRLESALSALPGPRDGDLAALGARLDGLAARADDIVAAARATRERADQNAAALNDLAARPLPSVSRGDIAALDERLSAIERSSKALAEEIGKRGAADTPDRSVRLALLADALQTAIERGTPFRAELSAVRALAPDAAALAQLNALAPEGVATPALLGRELAALIPALSQASGLASPEGGFLDRLQANAGRLVRIRPVGEPSGDDPASVIARIEERAAHAEVAGALAEFARLPASMRAPATAWLARAEARRTAVETARRFADDARAALAR